MSSQPVIIVDGYNYILRCKPVPRDNDKALWQAREEFVRQMSVYRAGKKLKVIIVFDGQDEKGLARTSAAGGISVQFSSAPQKADPHIIKLIEKFASPRNITLVTSDRALANLARSMGCTIWDTGVLLAKLARNDLPEEFQQKYNTNLGQNEIDAWLDLFQSGKPGTPKDEKK